MKFFIRMRFRWLTTKNTIGASPLQEIRPKSSLTMYAYLKDNQRS